MIPARFDYAAPESLPEAIAILQKQPAGKVLAGGHDLLTEMKLRRASPPMLVDLRKISSLRGIQVLSSGLRIGSMSTCTELAGNAVIVKTYQALAEAADSIGDAQVRNACTIGGNLASADPAGDLAAAVLVLDGVIQVSGPDGARAIPADQFFLGAFTTSLNSAEIITSIDLPSTLSGSGSAYAKIKNPANNYPICGVAASVVVGRDGTIDLCQVAVTGVTAHPRRLHAVESALKGKTPSLDNIRGACVRSADGLTLISNLYASGEYRGHLTAVLAEESLSRAVNRARGS